MLFQLNVLQVPWRGVVVGDILILRAGQRVAGDARLIEALALRTSETLISGEESPVSKDATAIVGAESDVFQQINMVFAHTRVVSGEGRALVVATGTDTYVARSNLLAINTHERETQLDADINRLTWLTTVASLLLIGAVLVLGYFRQYDDKFLVVGAATLVFACIPQNIPTLARCVLSMASSSLTHSKILIKKMSTAASLGSVTSVVTGKTSSLTENACALEVIGMYDRLNERQHAVPQANEVLIFYFSYYGFKLLN
jgi:Ca2+-transporting ATPase